MSDNNSNNHFMGIMQVSLYYLAHPELEIFVGEKFCCLHTFANGNKTCIHIIILGKRCYSFQRCYQHHRYTMLNGSRIHHAHCFECFKYKSGSVSSMYEICMDHWSFYMRDLSWRQSNLTVCDNSPNIAK